MVIIGWAAACGFVWWGWAYNGWPWYVSLAAVMPIAALIFMAKGLVLGILDQIELARFIRDQRPAQDASSDTDAADVTSKRSHQMPPAPQPLAQIQKDQGLSAAGAQTQRTEQEQAYTDWHVTNAPGMPIDMPPAGPPLRDSAVKQSELSRLLSDPRPMSAIQAEWDKQDGSELELVRQHLPAGFTVSQQDGRWTLFDPAGNARVQTDRAWPTQNDAAEMFGAADHLARNSGIDWSQFMRHGTSPRSPTTDRPPTSTGEASQQ